MSVHEEWCTGSHTGPCCIAEMTEPTKEARERCPSCNDIIPDLWSCTDSFHSESYAHQKALRAFYSLFGRLGLTMICEATLEQCLDVGIKEIDKLHAGAVSAAERERNLHCQLQATRSALANMLKLYRAGANDPQSKPGEYAAEAERVLEGK